MRLVKKNMFVVLCTLSLLLAWSCAQIVQPGGGDDDTTPPILLSEGSTPNGQTNFVPNLIELTFNEWITVSNPTKEVFVSPPLDYPLQVKGKGKTVAVEFNENEVLKENTTYQINFGKAIKDLTAGNEMEDYTFLFSTGDQLDQLSVEGRVVEFSSQSPVKDVIVLLHDNLADTSFATLKPTYLTRTDEEGRFELKNLRADSFHIFALLDGNVSYTYDLQSEKVAFLDSTLVLVDSMPPLMGIKLELFDEEDAPRHIESRQKLQGLVKIVYQPQLSKATVTNLYNPVTLSHTEFKGDTLYYWHDSQDSLQLAISYDVASDTVKVRAAKKSVAAMKLMTKIKRIKTAARDTIKINWSKPIGSIDTLRMSVSDTIATVPFVAGYEGQMLWLLPQLSPNAAYELRIDSAAVTDWYGTMNEDSIDIAVTTIDPAQLGQIKLSISKEDTLSYILELRSADALIKKWTINASVELTVPELEPGTYRVSITQDMNRDGKWSSGNIKEKRFPEAIREQTLEPLKSGWDLETSIDITQIFYDTQGG